MRKIAPALVLVLVVWLPASATPIAAPALDQEVPPRPNVLIIVTDDQPTDTMEAMPHTARIFAERGVTFTNAYSTTPLCCPSRASIMTGLYAHNHNVQIQSRAGTTLDTGLTLQHHLAETGYYTGFIGKWLNGWNLAVRPPYLNEVAVFTSAGVSYSDSKWNVDGTVRTVPGYSTDFMTKRSRGFIERAETQDDVPWMLVMNPPQPHKPFTPQPQFAEERFSNWESAPNVGEEDKSDKPPWIEPLDAGRFQGRRIRTAQMRSLRSVDAMVAKTFRALAENGESVDTLAIFTSDNGYLWGEHGIANIKRFPYTASVQVPMYLRWPGHVPPGTVDDRFAANIDIAPTALEAAGLVDRLPDLDGRSLLQPSGRQRILLEYWHDGVKSLNTWASIRTTDNQYIEYYDDTGFVTYREYYDLIEDPYQLENLLDNGNPLDDPQWITLSNDLAQMRDCAGATCP